jgi:hypothetical protein
LYSKHSPDAVLVVFTTFCFIIILPAVIDY